MIIPEATVNICTNYKIEERDLHKSLNVIRTYGISVAMDIAYEKALQVVTNEPESILCVMLLAWSKNLLEDARVAENRWEEEDLRILAYFYRKLAHKVYWYQRQNDEICEFKDFIREV